MRSERARGVWGALLSTGLLMGACANILGVTDGKQQGACKSDSECAPHYGCIQESCRSGCSSDQDCDAGSRCLKVVDAYGCIPLSQGCGAGCPTGTACVGGVCRTDCSVDDDCASGQMCQLPENAVPGACVGTDGSHDTPPDPDVSSMGGGSDSGGTGGTRGVGGEDTTMGGTGGEAGEPSLRPQCSAGKNFCAGNELRTCSGDGLASSLVSTCEAGTYCDNETGSCKTGVCTPRQPACDGNTAAVCNASGSGFEVGGEACAARKTCSDGECKSWLCEPGETFCQGHSRFECSSNGLSTSEIEVCKNGLFCQESAGSSACVTQLCQPNAQLCSNNTSRQCNVEGSGYALEQNCGELNETCVGGVCAGECKPSQLNCGPGNKLQSCDSSGHWTTGTECAADETCYQGACGGECGPTQLRCSADNAVQGCDATGHFSGSPCAVDKTCLNPAGVPACGGACGPTQTSCVGTLPQSCDATGKWKSGAVAKDTCGAACSPGGPTQCSSTLLQTCKADGQWDAGALVIGKCGAECTPDAVRCSATAGQVCSSGGTWGANGSNVPCKCWIPDRFKRGGTNLALDTKTGLIWEATQRPAASWAVASKACSDAGMRLPTYNEMHAVVIFTTYAPPNCDHGFFSPFDSAGMPTSLEALGFTSASTNGKVEFWTQDILAMSGTTVTAVTTLESAYIVDSVTPTNYAWLVSASDFPPSTALYFRCVK